MGKKIFTVMREHWVDSQSSEEDAKVRPVAAFTTHKLAEDYIRKRLEHHPENLIFKSDDGLFYEDGGREFDSFEIFELEVDLKEEA